ncbi:MAG TPA: hypothetical protein VMP68_08920 [Candidatus Eisenbacteria bacterium]|nr:hypothetical protein [Candidatus Eisenbacteria bacterium]
MGVWYATQEQILNALEILQSSYSNALIGQKLEWSSRSIERQLHRRFYPELRTISKDWPNYSDGYAWQIDLNDQEMISLTSVVSGGTDITSDCFLRRGDDLAEPPYSILQVSLASRFAFSTSVTFQKSLVLTGLFGYKDTDTSLPSALFAVDVNSSATSITLKPSNNALGIGVGSLIYTGTERMLITARVMASTGETISADVAAAQASTSLSSAGAANFGVGEVILIDSERMRINDIAGTTLIVDRAWDGTVLATHSSGAGIYALRQCTVERGALGSTAASHTTGDAVYSHSFEVNELCIAETVCALEQNAGAYARTIGTGSSARDAVGGGLEDIRDMTYAAYGRMSRSDVV